MQNRLTPEERRAMRSRVREYVGNRWPDVLAGLGLPADAVHVSNKGRPCPMCGGKDRYVFNDKYGNGTWHCRHCLEGGPYSSGLDLLMRYHNIEFPEAADRVLAYIGVLKDGGLGELKTPVRAHAPAPRSQLSPEEIGKRSRMHMQVLTTAKPVQPGDPVDRWLRGRLPGLVDIPKALRFHPALDYSLEVEPNRFVTVGLFPAMVAPMVNPKGIVVNVHRTYLTEDGRKARIVNPHTGEIVDDVRKVMRSIGEKVSYIPLFPGVHDELGVAEGPETALAAHIHTGVCTQSAVNGTSMVAFHVPDWVHKLVIFADHDLPKTRRTRNGVEQWIPGLEYASKLAQRPDIVKRVEEGTLRVVMRTTAHQGMDMNDLIA